MKFACTVVLAVTVTVHVGAVPVHPPDQLVNRKPGSAVAESVNDVPGATLAVQVLPQLMPAGALVIEPLPPAALTDRVGLVVVPPPPLPVDGGQLRPRRDRHGQPCQADGGG